MRTRAEIKGRREEREMLVIGFIVGKEKKKKKKTKHLLDVFNPV